MSSVQEDFSLAKAIRSNILAKNFSRAFSFCATSKRQWMTYDKIVASYVYNCAKVLAKNLRHVFSFCATIACFTSLRSSFLRNSKREMRKKMATKKQILQAKHQNEEIATQTSSFQETYT